MEWSGVEWSGVEWSGVESRSGLDAKEKRTVLTLPGFESLPPSP
jgi:hypothetical protein